MPKELKKYSNALIKLFKYKVIENTDSDWENLNIYKTEIQEYLYVIGQEMVLLEKDGIAFRQQLELEDNEIIKLANKYPLQFITSAVLIYLSDKYYRQENDATRITDGIFVTQDEIKTDVGNMVFATTENVDINKKITEATKRLSKYGYLKEISSNDNDIRYKVIPIVKYKVSREILEDFKNKLKEKYYDTDK